MTRLQKVTQPLPSQPSMLRRTLTAPLRWVQKAFTMLSIHTSSWFVGLNSSWTEGTYAALAEKTMTNAVAYRCYRLISDTMSSIGIFAATETTNEEGEPELKRDPKHPFILLLNRPNPVEPSYENFIMRLIADLFFGGEVFFYAPLSPFSGPNQGKPLVRADGSGDPGLFLIRPDLVQRIERKTPTEEEKEMMAIMPVTFYHWIMPDGTPRTTDAARIQHIKLIDPRIRPQRDNFERGFPIALAVWQEIQLIQSGNDWNKSVFENKGRVPGFFKYMGKGSFREEQYKQTKEHIQAAYRNDAEKSMPGLLAGDYDFIESSTSQREADWLRGAQQYARWIAVGMGVDPALIGDQGSRTLANLSIAVRALYTLTVLPLLDWIVDEWNARYMPGYGEALLHIDREGIDALQEDRTAVIERAVRSAGVPILTRAEARQMAGFDAESDGTFFVPSGVEEEGEIDTTRIDLMDDEQMFALAKSLWSNGHRVN